MSDRTTGMGCNRWTCGSLLIVLGLAFVPLLAWRAWFTPAGSEGGEQVSSNITELLGIIGGGIVFAVALLWIGFRLRRKR